MYGTSQPTKPYIGIESSGIVTVAGEHLFKNMLGQRGMTMVGGGDSTHARCRATSAHAIGN